MYLLKENKQFDKYFMFIENCRKKEPKLGHQHHIIPKHLGGTDSPDNLIYLGYQDHHQAHLILAYCFPKNSDFRKKNLLSAQLLSSWLSKKVLENGWKHSEESKLKMSEIKKNLPPRYGKDNGFFGKSHTEETKKQISQSSMGNQNTCKPYNVFYKGKLIDELPSRNEAIKYCKKLGLPFNPIINNREERKDYKILKKNE